MNVRSCRRFPWIVTLACGLAVAGCGGGSDSGPDVVAVSGIVKMDGQPLANATVNFVNEQLTATGMTDEEGRFTLGGGAGPGTNTVVISKWSGNMDMYATEDGGVDMEQLAAAGMAAPGARTQDAPKQLVPPVYSDPAKTSLTFDVPSDGSDVANFELLSKDK